MARLEDIPQPTRDAVAGLQMPPLEGSPWVAARPLKERRIAMVTSAALHRRSEPPFAAGSAEYRELPSHLPASEIRMSHISINYDRVGWQRDINTIYPIDRLKELARDGIIGAVADTHFSVMGSTDPVAMGETVEALTARLRKDAIDAVLFCPV